MEQQQKKVIGVDLGGTNMRAGRIYGQTLEAEASFPTPAHAQTQEETIEALIRVIEAVWDNTVQAIGIGVPSVVDRGEGTCISCMNLPHVGRGSFEGYF